MRAIFATLFASTFLLAACGEEEEGPAEETGEAVEEAGEAVEEAAEDVEEGMEEAGEEEDSGPYA